MPDLTKDAAAPLLPGAVLLTEAAYGICPTCSGMTPREAGLLRTWICGQDDGNGCGTEWELHTGRILRFHTAPELLSDAWADAWASAPGVSGNGTEV